MIIIKKKKSFLKATQKWFPEIIRVRDCLSITMYKQVDCHIKSPFVFIKEKSFTLQTNLTQPIEDIFKKFSATIRNELRRTEKEDSTYTYNEKPDVFLSIFNDFATQKGLACHTDESLNAFGSYLVLTSIAVNGLVTAVHSYLIDSELKKVRLLHSATLRFSDNLDSNMIARSNKYLHYLDLKRFKAEGFEIYDWGGISVGSEDKSLLGINKFKESLGGELIEQVNLYSPLYFLILKFFKSS
jgi:hypothetical protein